MKSKLAPFIKALSLLALLVVLVPGASVFALTANQKSIFDEGIYYFNTDEYSDCGYSGQTGSVDASANAKTVFDFLLSKGLQAPQVAAIAGNIQIESGFDPTSYNPHTHTNDPTPEHAFGLAQWLGGRQTNLRSLAESRNLPITDLGVQMDFMWQELSGPYKDSVLAPLQAASDLFAMADVVNQHYEVSGTDSTNRFNAAQNLLAQFGSDAPGNYSGGSSSACGGSSSGPTADCSVTQPIWGSVHGSGSEYSQAQLAQLFGDPGTKDNHPAMDANLTHVDFNGHDVLINNKAAGCLKAVAADISASGSTYKIRMMGCYRFDSDNGTSNIGLRSYHTYGVACDINWDTNPFVESGADTPHDMPQEFIQAFYNHGFTWGGNWNKPKDYMHFEFNGITPP